jgi:hypothetical protein
LKKSLRSVFTHTHTQQQAHVEADIHVEEEEEEEGDLLSDRKLAVDRYFYF